MKKTSNISIKISKYKPCGVTHLKVPMKERLRILFFGQLVITVNKEDYYSFVGKIREGGDSNAERHQAESAEPD